MNIKNTLKKLSLFSLLALISLKPVYADDPIVVEGEEEDIEYHYVNVDDLKEDEKLETKEDDEEVEYSYVNIDQELTNLEKLPFDYSNFSRRSLVELSRTISARKPDNTLEDVFYSTILEEVNKAISKGEFGIVNEDPRIIIYERAKDNDFFNDLLLLQTPGLERDYLLASSEKEKRLEEEDAIIKEIEESNASIGYSAWSENFLEEFRDGETSGKEMKLFDIFSYFEDGKYQAPVSYPNLYKILEPYNTEVNGMVIEASSGDNLYSIAKDGEVKREENKLIITYSNGTQAIYTNIDSALRDGDHVDIGDVVGYVDKKDSAYDGFLFELVVDGIRVSPEWLMTPFPFFTDWGVPLMLQTDNSWGSEMYGDSTIRNAGCGPTALSMAVSHLTKELVSPSDVVAEIGGKRSSYMYSGVGSAWTLMEDYPVNKGLKSRVIRSNEIFDELYNGSVIIASMGRGRFTRSGHYITLTGVTPDGEVLVNDPNDSYYKEFYKKSFNLYDITKEAKNFWAISK